MRETSAAIQFLCDDFRRHLEKFYATLQLAPPYHSVEKAIGHLTSTLSAMALEEQEEIRRDPARQWALYCAAFVESGLSKKHRGIIAELVRSGRVEALPPPYKSFLEAVTS
jgi:hypothetical protein